MAYVGTFAVAGDAALDWAGLARALTAGLAGRAGPARLGVTPLGRGGVVARVLAPSAPALTAVAQALWRESRHRLFSLPPLALRKL
jgi:hypothetical protein